MSDADAVRLIPIYRAVKEMRESIYKRSGLQTVLAELEDLVEAAILTDGKIIKLKADIGVNDLLVVAQLLVERAESLKARLDAL
jgi:hypothetical protein